MNEHWSGRVVRGKGGRGNFPAERFLSSLLPSLQMVEAAQLRSACPTGHRHIKRLSLSLVTSSLNSEDPCEACNFGDVCDKRDSGPAGSDQGQGHVESLRTAILSEHLQTQDYIHLCRSGDAGRTICDKPWSDGYRFRVKRC